MKGIMKSLILSSTAFLGLLLTDHIGYAAKPVNLRHQSSSYLQSYLLTQEPTTTKDAISFKEISRSTDFNRRLHIRIQETYAGYPVFGADAVVHIPQGANKNESLANSLAQHTPIEMNGIIYQALQADLASTPSIVFTREQSKRAMQFAINAYKNKTNTAFTLSDEQSDLMVYIDKQNKAHWVYKISFYMTPQAISEMPEKPIYILDAISLKTYVEWNDIKTHAIDIEQVSGGGFGGNLKMGKLTYDGGENNLPILNVRRDAELNICYLQNSDVTVKNYRSSKNSIISFSCENPDVEHNNLYWDSDQDAANGGFSPANDALFSGAVVKDMYMDWYQVPVLTKGDKPMLLIMNVHAPMDNAYWDGRQMTFGDGYSMFYPLTSLGVAAHEISHGFTEQHSGLWYSGQSGGMNESFSDMAAQAAEFYAYKTNSWQIGPEIMKREGKALRYMDKPSTDCGRKEPGKNCSIDEVSQYHESLDVHYSSGIFNRVFYLIGTSPGWDTQKAFDIMIKANMDHWTSSSSFAEGACGVMKATTELGYDIETVIKAFNTVGVDIHDC